MPKRLFKKNLTQEQQAVISHQQGHARVRAVAGSGKTTTLVERVIHLLRQGTPAKRVLVVMYNRAAREDFVSKLQNRAAEVQVNEGIVLQLPDVRTFHSLGHRLTQTFCRWGVLKPHKLQQEEWMIDRLTRLALTQLAEQALVPLAEQGDELQAWLEDDALDAFKNFCTLVKSGLSPAHIVFEALDASPAQKYFLHAFEQLESILQAQRLMFFDDLLWRPLKVLAKQPELLNRLQGFLDYLIVDEYQDINEVQQALLKALAGEAQVMVVGDIDQCIYEWRGAKPEYMLRRFQQDFKQVQDYPLTHTFRFGHSLALAANQTIIHNKERPEQITLATKNAYPTLLQQGQGSAWLLEEFATWQVKHSTGSAAILVRSWAQSLDVQLELLKNHQPFQLARQEHFIFNRPQIRGLLAYARLALNSQAGMQINYQHPDAQQDFYQLLSFPTLYLKEAERQSLLQGRIQSDSALMAAMDALSKHKRNQVAKRLELLEKLAKYAKQLNPLGFMQLTLRETDALEKIRKTAPSKESGEEALRLIEGLRRYAEKSTTSDLGEWINQLEQAQQEGQTQTAIKETAQLMILTVHAAKGLEWDWVGIYGLNEGDFPYTSGFRGLTTAEEEAERRLFYVAITRAKHSLVLARSENAMQPSRFLEEAALQDASLLAALLHEPPNPLPASMKAQHPELLKHYWQAVSDLPPPLFSAYQCQAIKTKPSKKEPSFLSKLFANG
ncbi:MAG TPA: ATP-dependent helicase [Marinospirillum sp.]|uniref:ATP-dependent helicase n=1 Tax=Marinospirillum sp. TaxID=2183934 RepID=UPI002B46CBF8|nr:ATP-dependent helicase [Marinospirillum sp.]HKM15065.1 ATP-dependent helicase [Marinospirillum sp.]